MRTFMDDLRRDIKASVEENDICKVSMHLLRYTKANSEMLKADFTVEEDRDNWIWILTPKEQMIEFRDIHGDGKWLTSDFEGFMCQVKSWGPGFWKWDVFRIGHGDFGGSGYVTSTEQAQEFCLLKVRDLQAYIEKHRLRI